MFLKIREFNRAAQCFKSLLQSDKMTASLLGKSYCGRMKNFFPLWAQVCQMSNGSERKNVPCPCTPSYKIRKYKKKKYERCEKPIMCPSVKHKCTTDKSDTPKEKCLSNDQ